MDPLTQATIGAAAAVAVARPSETRLALVLGALAGAAPDLDVLIRSESDPLLALEYHRHFTHSLLTAPLIGLLVAILFRGLFFAKPWPFQRLALFGVIGALTHGLIDACTSYGTLLYWPLSRHRESWDIISIIDPLFTVPLCLLAVISFAFRRPPFARLAIGLCLSYLCFGMYQRSQALDYAVSLAESRGHSPTEMTVRPSLANTVLWRIVYRNEDRYYVDAVRRVPFSEPVHYPGGSVDAFGETAVERELPRGSILAADVERFRFFSQGYLYRFPQQSNVVGDLRYAMFPDSTVPLWGIRIDLSEPNTHAPIEYFRDPSKRAFERLWRMIRGQPVEPLH